MPKHLLRSLMSYQGHPKLVPEEPEGLLYRSMLWLAELVYLLEILLAYEGLGYFPLILSCHRGLSGSFLAGLWVLGRLPSIVGGISLQVTDDGSLEWVG
jgi:hypothetical protein